LNFLPMKDVRRMFFVGGSPAQARLTNPQHLNREVFTNVFHLTNSEWDCFFPQNYLKPSDSKSLISHNFRFCRSCLESGFHSALHQLWPLYRCPLHKELLRQKCPSCGSRQLFERTLKLFTEVPFQCPTCSFRLARPDAWLGDWDTLPD